MKTVKGDLLDMFDNGDFTLIIHGCNCHWAMGAGIAASIAKRYPQASKVDRENSQYASISKLSNHTIAHVGSGKLIVNLYTQYFPGKDLSKEALLLGFYKLSKVIPSHYKIGIPAIGCGIAGGKWDEIGPEIEKIMKGFDITYVEYEF